MIKILIVEDHDILAESLKAMLVDDYDVVGSVRDAKLSTLYCQKLMPDLVLMDVLTANNSDGIDACMELKNKFKNIKVLIVTGFDGVGYIKRAYEAGADGYITKDSNKEDILQAIKNVIDGNGQFPIINDNIDKEAIELTSKETEVLFYVCEGLTRSEIAEVLCVSEATIKTHLAKCLE